MLNRLTSRTAVLTIAAGLTLLACSEPPAGVTGADRPSIPAPALGLEDAPATSGPIVVRFESGFGLAFADFDRELLAFHLLDDSLLGCREGTAESERLTVQAILEPNGVAQFIARSDAAFTAVYDLTGIGLPSLPDICDFLLGPRRVAEGFSRFTLTENDFFDSGTRRRTFSFKANGRLENLLGDGELSYDMNARFLERDDGGLKVLARDVVLGPDPR